MRDQEGSEICTPRVNLLGEFCQEVSLDQLLSGDMASTNVALLFESALHGQNTCSRLNPGPLTVRQLYELLLKPRFRNNGCTCHASDEDRSNSLTGLPNRNFRVSPDEYFEPDAEQRIIYVTDLDPWLVLALVATVTQHQADPLRNVLYRHLSAEPYIGVTVPMGLSMFELAFHLPFRAWRPLQAGQTPAENAWDVSFLDWIGQTPQYIHHATYSLEIAGTDEWRWVAYCFIDTFFDVGYDDRESAERHYEDTQGLGSLPMDPCSNNRRLQSVGRDPRWWFLETLAVRLGMVKDEWTAIVRRIKDSIYEYRRVSSVFDLHQRLRISLLPTAVREKLIAACLVANYVHINTRVYRR